MRKSKKNKRSFCQKSSIEQGGHAGPAGYCPQFVKPFSFYSLKNHLFYLDLVFNLIYFVLSFFFFLLFWAVVRPHNLLYISCWFGLIEDPTHYHQMAKSIRCQKLQLIFITSTVFFSQVQLYIEIEKKAN